MERKEGRKWLAAWNRAGTALARLRREELRRLDYRAARPLVDALLEMAAAHRSPRLTSGLVEQQRLFARGRRR